MPPKIKNWLLARGISETVIDENNLKFEKDLLIIPIYDEKGSFLFNKYRRSPFVETGPKYTYAPGAAARLYMPASITNTGKMLIVEGELDALALVSHGYDAVSSTGGAGTFRKEWKAYLEGRQIYICYDNDTAGVAGTMRLLKLFPDARVVEIPETKGWKDISDFIAGNAAGLDALIEQAESWRLPPEISEAPSPKELKEGKSFCRTISDDLLIERQNRLKDGRSVAFIDKLVEVVVEHYEDLLKKTTTKRGRPYKLSSDALVNAKRVPITEYLQFDRQRKRVCIWHTEKTPSMVYYSKDNRVKCFGCGRLGDVIDIVEQLHGLTKSEAIKKINNDHA